jgi:hypothetical protein
MPMLGLVIISLGKKPGSRNMQTDQWITLFTPHKEL